MTGCTHPDIDADGALARQAVDAERSSGDAPRSPLAGYRWR